MLVPHAYLKKFAEPKGLMYVLKCLQLLRVSFRVILLYTERWIVGNSNTERDLFQTLQGLFKIKMPHVII